MTPPLKGVPIFSPEIELLEKLEPLFSHCFQIQEIPWGAIISAFFKTGQKILETILLVFTIQIHLKKRKKSRAYGAILPFENDQN